MRQWFNVRKEKGKVGTVRIYGRIGTDFFSEEGTNARKFCESVDELGDLKTLNVHINSEGGSIFCGIAIFHYLRRNKAKIVVHIDGIAASIASVIAMAGDKIIMPENANLFIHNPWTFAGGDSKILRKTAEDLDTMRASLLGIYMQRSTLDEADVAAMMDKETLLTAEECVEWGFADEITPAIQMAAGQSAPEMVAAARAAAVRELEFAGLNAKARALEEKKSRLQAKLDEAEATIRSLTPLGSKNIIHAVAQAQAPEWLAAKLIKGRKSETTTNEAIAFYKDLENVCTVSGIDAAIIQPSHMKDTQALISAFLVEFLANADDETEISNRQPGGGVGDPVKGVSHEKTYARRRPQPNPS